MVAKASPRWPFSLLLTPHPHPTHLPAFSGCQAAPCSSGLPGAITCGSEPVLLLAYIKHLAVSRRQALKAGMCSPRGEVTIQEFCFLKRFCKTTGLLGERGGQEMALKSRGGGKEMRILIFGFLKLRYWQRGSLHLPPLRKEAKMSSVSTSPLLHLPGDW